MDVHQQTHEPCLAKAGRCYHYDYCRVNANTVEDLKRHLVDDRDEHLESLMFKLEQLSIGLKADEKEVSVNHNDKIY